MTNKKQLKKVGYNTEKTNTSYLFKTKAERCISEKHIENRNTQNSE